MSLAYVFRSTCLGAGLLGALITSSLITGCGPDPQPPANTSGSGGDGGTTASSSGNGGTGGAGGNGGNGGGGTFDPESGWTEFKESPDTKKIYVSSSDGDDANDGSTPEKAVKTLAKGKSLLRDTMPDWMLLKRGDVWTEALGSWSKSGRSADEPMLVSTYGDAQARPLLRTGTNSALSAINGTLAHLAFVGLHFYAHTRDPGSPDFTGPDGASGVRWLAKTENLLFEDVMVQFYASTNFTIQGDIKNFKLRRSIVADSYFGGGHSNGLYLQDVQGVLIEENLLDHNGWNRDPKLAGQGTGPTIFNHNLYVQVSCSDVVIRGNITTRASSHGFQARPGGIVENNLVIDNPIGFSYGLVQGDSDPKPGGVTGHISGNIIRDSGDITLDLPRGFGMEIGNIQSAMVEDNILAHDKSVEAFGNAISLNRKSPFIPDEAIKNLTIRNNIIYDWRGGIRFGTTALENVVVTDNHVQQSERASRIVYYYQMPFDPGTSYANNQWFSIEDPAKWFRIDMDDQSYDEWLVTSSEKGSSKTKNLYVDPTRRLGTYHESLQKDPTFDAYIAEARKQSRKNYRYEYTAYGPSTYIRAGFAKQ